MIRSKSLLGLFVINLCGTLFVSGQVIYINFGSNTVSDLGWNNTSLVQAQSGWQDSINIPASLVDSTGATSSISMSVVNPYWSTNDGGFGGGAVGDLVAAATATTLYFQTGGAVNGDTPIYEFSGFDPDMTYDFEVFGSRPGGSTRSALYTFTGLTSGSEELNASFNGTEIASITGISPTVGGIITFEADYGSTNGDAWHYINAMKISAGVSAVPEPETYALMLGMFGLGFVAWNRRKRQSL